MTPATLTLIRKAERPKENEMEIHLISSVNNIAQYGKPNAPFYDAASRYCRDVLELGEDDAANAAFHLEELKKLLARRP